MKKVKIKDLPEAQSLTGLFVLATDANGNSYKVSMQAIIDACTETQTDNPTT